MTTELIQVLDEEERRWAQTLHIEEYQSQLARSVIQVQCCNQPSLFVERLWSDSFLLIMSSTIPEAEGGLRQIYVCKSVSRSKGGSLQSYRIG